MDFELKTQEGEVGTLAFYVCSWLLRELCESPIQLHNILTHLFIVFIVLYLDSMLWGLTPIWLTSFVLLFRSHRFSWAQLFVWSLRQYRQRRVFWILRRRFKDGRDKIPLFGHPFTSTHRPTYIHPYMYIHTLMLIIMPQKFLHWFSFLRKIWKICEMIMNLSLKK